MINRRRLGALLTAALMGSAAPPAMAGGKVTVFAAASLKTALDRIAAAWTVDTAKDAAISYAASPALARQIEQGAPADVFISADLDWMSYLIDRKLVAPGGAIRLLGNALVLIAPADSSIKTAIAKDFPLATLLGDGRLAMGDVKAVPAGKYGKASLESLGVWSAVEHKVAQAENVRATLKLVATGEAALGIVYKTDAIAEPAVKIIGTFPADSHPAIIYPVAVTADSQNPDATAFVSYLQSAKAQAIFKDHGFAVLVPVATN